VVKIKKLIKKTEFYILVTIILLVAVIEFRSGQFLTGNNLVDLIRSMIIPAMFAIGAHMVLISGGIDVSFTAVASLSMYVAAHIFLQANYEGSILLIYVLGAGFGLLLGALNAVLIAKFKFPTLIVTLGTSSLFTGIMLGVLSAHEIPVPKPMLDHGKAKLFSAYNEQLGLNSDMPVTLLLLIGLLLIAFFIMRYTMLGRGIYAVGGDEVSAQRSGFNVFAIHFFIYCFVGALAGITGIARASMMLNANPTNMLGMELTVIAAVVLGGARVTGGLGTLTGTMLGVALITIMSNSLILLGIPTYWQRVFTGVIIIIGTGVSAYQIMNSKRRLVNIPQEI
jgi:simple sugar transport system permease protein